MNTLAQFNDAMAYIERNLMLDIEPGQIARISGCSEYHFRRMFSFLAGMPLGEYIRRRRLSAAGLMLQNDSVKVIDLALQLGYESPVYDILHVAASTWAVFKAVGLFPEAIQDTWARIYGEWFPASGYELTGGPELLWNETPDTSRADSKSEIWIPVRKIDG